MSKELFERIERLIRSDAKPHYFIIELLTDCQQRIAELEERKTRDMHDLIVVLGERDKRIEELEQGVRYYQELRQFDQQTLALASVEQENSRLKAKHQQELEQQLRLEKQLLAAVKHTVVATIGGVDCEGYPTSEINYLQRLRILVEKEQENSRLKAELEAAEAITQELLAACKLAYQLPRPWMDGGITWPEWNTACEAIETAVTKVGGK